MVVFGGGVKASIEGILWWWDMSGQVVGGGMFGTLGGNCAICELNDYNYGGIVIECGGNKEAKLER